MHEEFSLKEAFFLLSTRESTGYPLAFTHQFGACMATAMLYELASLGCIELQNKRLVVVKTESTHDPVLDALLQRLQNTRHPKRIRSWVQKMGMNEQRLRREVADLLVEKKVLKKEVKRILGLFPYRIYKLVNPRPKKNLQERIGKALLYQRELTQKEILLACLLGMAQITSRLFSDRMHKKQARKRAKALIVQVRKAGSQDGMNAELLAAITATLILNPVVIVNG